jgi:hypothetical protein
MTPWPQPAIDQAWRFLEHRASRHRPSDAEDPAGRVCVACGQSWRCDADAFAAVLLGERASRLHWERAARAAGRGAVAATRAVRVALLVGCLVGVIVGWLIGRV